MKVSTERKILRWLHLIAGGVIATYIYSPWSGIVIFAVLTKFVVIPAVISTGLWMWKGHLIKRSFRSNKQITVKK